MGTDICFQCWNGWRLLVCLARFWGGISPKACNVVYMMKGLDFDKWQKIFMECSFCYFYA